MDVRKYSFVVLLIVFSLFSASMVYCFYYYQFWTFIDTSTFKSLVEYKDSNIKGYRGRQIIIHREFKPYMNRINEMAQKSELNLIILHSIRRSNSEIFNSIVNPSKVSNHYAGFALDFNIQTDEYYYNSEDLRKTKVKFLSDNARFFIKYLTTDRDLRWGGNFRTEDPVHVHHPINRNITLWRKKVKEAQADLNNAKYIWQFWK